MCKAGWKSKKCEEENANVTKVKRDYVRVTKGEDVRGVVTKKTI